MTAVRKRAENLKSATVELSSGVGGGCGCLLAVFKRGLSLRTLLWITWSVILLIFEGPVVWMASISRMLTSGNLLFKCEGKFLNYMLPIIFARAVVGLWNTCPSYISLWSFLRYLLVPWHFFVLTNFRPTFSDKLTNDANLI